MAVKAASENAALYERDLAAWAVETAELLRKGRLDEIDGDAVAEEIEQLARNDRNELKSRLIVLIAHLLKWKFQQSGRGNSWRATIVVQRDAIQDLLDKSPSLRRRIDDLLLDSVYSVARLQALGETNLDDAAIPTAFRFNLPDVLRPEFLPD